MIVIPRKNAPTKTTAQRNARTTAQMVYAISSQNVPKHVMTAATKTVPVLRPLHAQKIARIPAMKMAHAPIGVRPNARTHAMTTACVQFNVQTPA